MKDSIRQRLQKLSDRFEEVGRLLSSEEVAGGSRQFRELSMEYSRLQPLATRLQRYHGLERDLQAAHDLQNDADAGMRALGGEELARLQGELAAEELELRRLLLPKDPRDERSIFLEVRAGTGGDEAAIFAGDLYRMYARYAEAKGFSAEVLSESPGEHGGFREIISRIAGKGAFSRLKFESGTHRVQRVPATEAQGRIHTSACTVAILPELDEVDEVEINPAELRIDTYRSSGAGGQHVNKTDSAVRLTHIPTGIVVACQNERSQHKNRAMAMKILKSRLYDLEIEKQKEKMETYHKTKKDIAWGSQIRSYVLHPYRMVKDHRTNVEVGNADAVLDGDIDQFIQAYLLKASESPNGS
jgi:peptide chain release factor 1